MRDKRKQSLTMRVAFLRRRAKHLVALDGPVTLCGYTIPRMARWRIREPGVRPGNWVTCQKCRGAAAALEWLEGAE